MTTAARVALFGLIVASSAFAQDVPLFVLTSSPGGLTIERLTIPDGTTQIIMCGGNSDAIDIICPPSVGGSGSLAQTSQSRVIMARNQGGKLLLTEDPNGKKRELPVLDDAEACDIRVSVTAADGKQQAFLITGYDTVIEDHIGPVIDMFAGKVPLGPGDYVVCTDTVRVQRIDHTYGEAPLEHQRYLFVRGKLPGGAEGDFCVDLGAGETVVTQAFLPDGIEIEKSYMTQYSSAGKKLLKYAPGGATGAVETIQGHATLPELRFGTLAFKDSSVAVISELPDVFGRPIAGILGIDMLRRAECVTITYPGESGRNGSLRLAPKESERSGSTQEIPFAVVNTHLMVKANVNDAPVSFILDTGSPSIFLDTQAADTAKIQTKQNDRGARGIDEGERIDTGAGVAKSLRIGDDAFENVNVVVGALPVFAPMRSHGQCVGLLGNSLFARYAALEVDFGKRVVRFIRE